MRALLVWACVTVLAPAPLALAAQSPLLAWRDPIYIMAGFAGVAAMGLLLVQVTLGGMVYGQPARLQRKLHRVAGAGILALLILHIAGLWLTSPPDVVDALLFRSPTPFAVWGVLAMWAVLITAGLAIWRRRLRFRTWRHLHLGLGLVIVVGTVLHAILIEGTMEALSKYALSAGLLLAFVVLGLNLQHKGRGQPRPSSETTLGS